MGMHCASKPKRSGPHLYAQSIGKKPNAVNKRRRKEGLQLLFLSLFFVKNNLIPFVLGIPQSVGFFHFLFAPGLHDERISHEFPQVLGLDVQAEFLGQAFHDLVAAVVAGRNDELRARVFDLLRLDPSVVNSFV